MFNDNGKLQGEATPTYLFNLVCHKNIFETVPNTKIIISLRDPVTRAHSHFNHLKQVPHSFNWCCLPDGTFEENIDQEIRRGIKNGLIGRGFYMDQIEHLLRYFPEGQIMIIISERMREDMRGTYDSIYDFLGVERFRHDFEENIHKREYSSPMDEKTEKRLYQIYQPRNERLFDFLGYRVSEWERH